MRRFFTSRIRLSAGIAAVSICFVGCLANAQADEVTEVASKVTAENADRCDSLSLMMAAGKALKEGRTEDAGFYLYAGQLRAAVDMQVFEPKGTGGNSPAVALGAIQETLGPAINPNVMRDRTALARIVDRLEKWTPAFTPEYKPGWEFKAALIDVKRGAIIKELKEPRLAQLRKLSDLLNDEQYYAAFKTVQDYNFSGDDFQWLGPDGKGHVSPRKVSKAEYTVAMDQMKQIEKTRGVKSGLFPDEEDKRQTRKTDYRVVGGKVTFGGLALAGADPATFKVLAEVDYATDARHVYVRGFEIRGADANSFRVITGPYARDQSRLYCGNVPMKVADIDRFQVIRDSGSWQTTFVKTGLARRYGDVFDSIEVDRDRPAVVGEAWGRDGKNCFYGPAIIEGADYATFKPIGFSYAEDKTRGYDGRKPIKKSEIPNWARDLQDE